MSNRASKLFDLGWACFCAASSGVGLLVFGLSEEFSSAFGGKCVPPRAAVDKRVGRRREKDRAAGQQAGRCADTSCFSLVTHQALLPSIVVLLFAFLLGTFCLSRLITI